MLQWVLCEVLAWRPGYRLCYVGVPYPVDVGVPYPVHVGIPYPVHEDFTPGRNGLMLPMKLMASMRHVLMPRL